VSGGKWGRGCKVLGRWDLKERKQVMASAEAEGCLLVSCAVEVGQSTTTSSTTTSSSMSGSRAEALAHVSSGGSRSAWTLCKINFLCGMRETMRPPMHAKPITDCKVEPQRGEVVLTCSLDKTARMTRIGSGNEIGRWTLPVPLWSCCWHPCDAGLFLCGGVQNKLFLIDTNQPAALKLFPGPRPMPTHSLAVVALPWPALSPASTSGTSSPRATTTTATATTEHKQEPQEQQEAHKKQEGCLVIGGTLGGLVCWTLPPSQDG
jgi:hypothetical protein